jgi:hypothetical protein
MPGAGIMLMNDDRPHARAIRTRHRTGPLTSQQHADAAILAGAAARAIVAKQVGAADVEAGADFRFIMQQAAGTVSVQLGVPVDEAALRLRAHCAAPGGDATLQ